MFDEQIVIDIDFYKIKLLNSASSFNINKHETFQRRFS